MSPTFSEDVPMAAKKTRKEKLMIVLLWLVIGWMIWDFFYWASAPPRNDPVSQSHRIFP